MSRSFDTLLDVIDTLLGPEGCPWDKEQTSHTLCDYIIEEAFELVEAIRDGKPDEAAEELGDLMFLLCFISRCFQQEKTGFTMDDSLDMIRRKMIRRHPHVFGEETVDGAGEVLTNWEKIKRAEKADAAGENEPPKGVFSSLPKGLPPLLRAYRIHSKAARNGFTWATDADLDRQLESEWKEWQEAAASGDQQRKEEEFGDYLFTLVELGRRHTIKSNSALHDANVKFLNRFDAMEKAVQAQGKDVADLDMDALNALWDEVKKEKS